MKSSFYRRIGKRMLDLTLTSTALVCLSPVFAAVAVLVRFKLGSPILFRQQRPGLRARPFMMMKFRTMTDARDATGELLPDAERLPPFGQFLRSTSLDELPELVNVLKGEMSLVGPRPLLMRYLDRYTPQQRRRHEVPPGITGWAQVNGRNAISWEKKFELDVWYADRCSLWLDVRVLWMTVLKVVGRADINQEGHATQSEFMGDLPALENSP